MHQHRQLSPECAGDLVIDVEAEVQRGLAWQERLKCPKCTYLSPLHKLYEEIATGKRGPKPASVNYGLQVGLCHTSISNTSLCNILHAMNTPSPSLSGMTRNSNAVSDIIEDTNKKDMKCIKENLTDLNTKNGLEQDHPINVEIDCRYNNLIRSKVGKSPFQAGTQMTQVVVENNTPKKYVISVNNKSKLCQTCKRSSPTSNHRCTANIKEGDSIGDEKRWTSESLKQLQDEDRLLIRRVTTDPDSSTYKAAEERYADGDTNVKPLHQLDSRHVGNNLRKQTIQSQFSKNMFGCRTKAQSTKLQTRFANDLASRCHAEHAAAMKHHRNDASKVNDAMTTAKEAILKCYSGDHDECKKSSYVCNGCDTKNWLTSSAYLGRGFCINPTDTDITQLRKLIDIRLSTNALRRMIHLSSTQKCEAVNHAISASVPKNKTFSHNYSGRVHAAIHRVNRGIGDASLVECQSVNAPITHGTRVTRSMLRMQQHNQVRQAEKKSLKCKARRKSKVTELYKLYDSVKKPINTTYKSGLLVNELFLNDHTCSKKKQEKHHVWVQTARLYLHLICIISNKYQNSGILSKTKKKQKMEQSIPKHI